MAPLLAYTQNEEKGPVIVIDFGKKKREREEMADSIKNNTKEEKVYMREDEKLKPVDEPKKEQQEDPVDFKNGLFRALFIGGLNLSQVDGDDQAGYVHPGFYGGVGVLVKFHRHMSVSTAILYNMKGATQRLNANDPAQRSFRIQWDYIQVPLMFNVHDKKVFMANVGLGFGYLIRNKINHRALVSDSTGAGVVGEVPNSTLKNPEPRRFDLTGIAGFQFLIKQVFAVGAQFEYSLVGLRNAAGTNTRVRRMYNNTVTIKLMYILNPIKKKK